MASRISRAQRKLRDEGVEATAARAWELVRRPFYRHEEHVWYQLDLRGERPRRELADGVRLERHGPEAAHRVEELGQEEEEARRRLAAGNDLWMALDEQDRLLFACWIFRSAAPVVAAPGGSLRLPSGTVCLEDSVTTPRARGRGIAPGSWTAIADSLAGEGFDAMITKVATDNAPSRKAVEKAGFHEIAIMRYVRVGPRQEVTLSARNGGVADALAQGLAV